MPSLEGILPKAQALCSATCVLVQRSSTMSMGAAGSTAATASGGPAAILVMAQAASNTVFSSTAVYCLHHVTQLNQYIHSIVNDTTQGYSGIVGEQAVAVPNP